MTSSNPKVSVIIPAYNVEKYIQYCVDSILKNTYENFEVIIVNDGSTDRTEEACKDLLSDPRVRLISQGNSGVSAARNTGIRAANGDYVTFIDGDDFVDEDYLSYFVNLAENTDSDFCISKYCYKKRGEQQTQDLRTEVYSNLDATALLLSDVVVVGCWNKIYKRSFLLENSIWFNEDLFYGEGLQFITTCALKAPCTGVGNKKVYYYRRNNAASATTKFNIDSVLNGEKSIDRIEAGINETNDYLDAMLLQHRCIYYVGALVKIRNNNLQIKYRNEYQRWEQFLHQSYGKVARNKYISGYRKALILGGCVSPYWLGKLDIIRRRRISKHSVS
jgi:glycosyltransferase involved in cell wall biosynthesis